MSTEENKALALRVHLEIMNRGKLDVADEIIDRDVIWHSSLVPPEAQRGPDGFKGLPECVAPGSPTFG